VIDVEHARTARIRSIVVSFVVMYWLSFHMNLNGGVPLKWATIFEFVQLPPVVVIDTEGPK